MKIKPITKRKKKGPAPNMDRNLELIKDYNQGMSIVSMVGKYRISSARIYKLLKLHGKRVA